MSSANIGCQDLFRLQVALLERGTAPTDKIRSGAQGKVAALTDNSGKVSTYDSAVGAPCTLLVKQPC